MKEDHEEQNDLCVKFDDGREFEKSTSGYSVAQTRIKGEKRSTFYRRNASESKLAIPSRLRASAMLASARAAACAIPWSPCRFPADRASEEVDTGRSAAVPERNLDS